MYSAASDCAIVGGSSQCIRLVSDHKPRAHASGITRLPTCTDAAGGSTWRVIGSNKCQIHDSGTGSCSPLDSAAAHACRQILQAVLHALAGIVMFLMKADLLHDD